MNGSSEATFINEEAKSAARFSIDMCFWDYSAALKAQPHETQHIFDEIWTEMTDYKARPLRRENIRSKEGFEYSFQLEVNGIIISKRIFHPRGEPSTGADLIFSKLNPRRPIDGSEIVAIQVKRNHNKPNFVFSKREVEQVDTLIKCFPRGAYYLMVDETAQYPIKCYILAYELRDLIYDIGNTIPNEKIHELCRGPKLFYQKFYSCVRGSHYMNIELETTIKNYNETTKRMIVEVAFDRPNYMIRNSH